jgi:hypothetical protein
MPMNDTKSSKKDGVATIESIGTALDNAENAILNQHIKIN